MQKPDETKIDTLNMNLEQVFSQLNNEMNDDSINKIISPKLQNMISSHIGNISQGKIISVNWLLCYRFFLNVYL